MNKKYLFIIGIFIIGITLVCAVFFLSRSKGPNIVLIIMDAVRPDHLSCYGYERKTSPYIDQLAEEGVRFTQAIAAAGWTGESVPSILTGTYPTMHSIHDWKQKRNPTVDTIASLLKKRSYRTYFFSNHHACKMLDITNGFDTVHVSGYRKETEEELNKKAIAQIKKNKKRKFFLYLHYFGAHMPYKRLPEPHRSKYIADEMYKRLKQKKEKEMEIVLAKVDKKRRRKMLRKKMKKFNDNIAYYDGQISYVDEQIKDLSEELKKLKLNDNTVFIISADHGEMLGEQTYYYRHLAVYEPCLRVPLIIRYPKLFPSGTVISNQVSLIDLVPTFLRIADIDIPHYIQGRDLLDTVNNAYGEKQMRYIYASSTYWSTVRSEEWKLIRVKEYYKMYNIKKDPEEQTNLFMKEGEKFNNLKKILTEYDNQGLSLDTKDITPLDEHQKEILKSLGYMQ
ncbi:sulfatase [Spirochaetota bacterium]